MSIKNLLKHLFILAAVTACLEVSAQSVSQLPPLPVDKDVRIGRLPNGLTYYIRHNEYPKGQADFYIAQKVGSILEEDNQRGLAHFLEHMCFNGTKNFPGNEVVSWLETVGVKFGQNLNAYTSVDETVYNISNVPVARESVQDSCLLILHDWANDLLLDPEEIDKERGVIHQEWRRSMVGQMRILEKVLPDMYPGSRYGYRLPIGTMEVVDSFPPQDLRNYYERWYRPDQQGVIIVGDVDVDRIEGKIKEMFSDIEMPADAPERVYFPVEDNKGTLYAIGSDPEQQSAVVELMFKTEAFPDSLKDNVVYLCAGYLNYVLTHMLRSRLSDIASRPDAPFAGASASYGDFFMAKTKDALTLSGAAKDGDVRPVVEALYRELLRAVRGGFTASEYDRARSEYLSRLESLYNGRNKVENDSYVQEYVRNFIDNEPIPGIEYEHQVLTMLANALGVDEVNKLLRTIVTDDNRVILALLPDKEGTVVPTPEQLGNIMSRVDGETIEAYVDDVKSEPLIPELPQPGCIVSERTDERFGAVEWLLSNGATVLVKNTPFKDDEILFEAIAKGGTSVFGDEDAANLIFMPVALSQNGLGDYSYSDLNKYMSGKQAAVDMRFDAYSREVKGFSTPKDLPTLMELIYMTFTSLDLKPDEYAALQANVSGMLQNQLKDPQYNFLAKMSEALFKSPAKGRLNPRVVSDASRGRILDMSHEMLANAADYTFVFVGNVEPDTLRPLVEQYIATLPGNPDNKTEIVHNPALSITRGAATDQSEMRMENPQAFAGIFLSGDAEYTPLNTYLASIAGQILTARLIETVREKEGAVYSIGASGSMSRTSDVPVIMQTAFPLKPEMKDKVLAMIADELDRMAESVSDAELAKVKEFMVKEATEGKERNEAWLSAISLTQLNGVDTFNGNIEVINSVTPAQVLAFMRNLLDQNNYRVVVLMPEE
ncbi:MAG: insulinase family protein [Pseudoflavonifractor sp.]|nr:insulinase family protein [Pseudoflavonifractor sp.]